MYNSTLGLRVIKKKKDTPRCVATWTALNSMQAALDRYQALLRQVAHLPTHHYSRLIDLKGSCLRLRRLSNSTLGLRVIMKKKDAPRRVTTCTALDSMQAALDRHQALLREVAHLMTHHSSSQFKNNYIAEM